MATKQRIVYGATTEWSADDTTYDNIPETKAIVVPTIDVEYQDATHLESPGGYREFVPGLKDSGLVEIPCGFSTEGYNLAHGYMTNGALVYFRTTLPVETGQTTGDIFAFTGYVVPKLETNGVGDIIGMMLSIRISGQPTYTTAVAA